MSNAMPRKLIAQKDLKNWDVYSDNLSNKDSVEKYLGDTFKQWVENLQNPLAIPWIVWLFEGRVELDKSDEILKTLETKLGKDNLEKLSKELGEERSEADYIFKKILSLEGEVTAYKQLSKEYQNLKKISTGGDWGNDSVVVSVKSILDLDLNYQLIENTIYGLFFVKEHELLREYNRIILTDQKNIDDKFRKQIMCFLETHLLEALRFYDFSSEHFDDVETKATKFYLEGGRQEGRLEVHCSGHKDSNKKTLEIVLKGDRVGKQELEHQIKIRFIRSEAQERDQDFSVQPDTDTWWENESLNRDYLRKSIIDHLKKFDLDSTKVHDKKFIGWINISIHPRHRSDILCNKEKIEEFLKKVTCNRQYKVIFAFVSNEKVVLCIPL